MEASEYDPLQRTLYLASAEVGDPEIDKSGVSSPLDPVQLDRERHEQDRAIRRGYDYDATAPSHAEFIARQRPANRLAKADGWPLLTAPHPAYAIVATCERYGVALRIDKATGDLVVGKAGANEPRPAWPSLLIAIEAHLEAVAALVASGWNLQAEFPQRGAA